MQLLIVVSDVSERITGTMKLLHGGSQGPVAPEQREPCPNTAAGGEGTPYCSFFNFWITAIPASSARAFLNDLKSSMAETRNFMRRCPVQLFDDVVQVLAGSYL